MKKMTVFLCGMLLVFLVAGTVHAALSFAVVYDDVNNIFWLQDAKMTAKIDWYMATAWAEDLDDGAWDDWRLPTIDELIHLYNVEGVRYDNMGPFKMYSPTCTGLVQSIPPAHPTPGTSISASELRTTTGLLPSARQDRQAQFIQ